ncbi:ATP-binding cassette domain-containing protein, partial [Salmonella enterica subsp. enterica serovar Dublin]|nr:ATP-binding cassette domain-containing protein [Salmonella enterica subsp. enterica serovar Dublin]
MIETHKVAKTHGSTTVLHGVSVQIPVGQFTAIIGPNGAGKSTLLSMVSRL